MKRIAYLLFSMILLLAACSSNASEPAASAPTLTTDEAQPVVDEPIVPETAVNEQAARPQFIMFTASW